MEIKLGYRTRYKPPRIGCYTNIVKNPYGTKHAIVQNVKVLKLVIGTRTISESADKIISKKAGCYKVVLPGSYW